MYEHLFTEPYLQGFKTGKQNNTLGEQCQIWNSNVLVNIFKLKKAQKLKKSVGESYEDGKT